MADQVLQSTHLNSWLSPKLGAARWCVAFSGGPDSTALLHLIHTWCLGHSGNTPPLFALHVNHGMQSDADKWQLHCESLCAAWGIPIIVSQALVDRAGQGSEAAAREARYCLFEAEIEAGDILFMGHHLDDQVETYFLRLMRGSGLSGLSGIPARRKLGGGELIRPLLEVERRSLEEYITAHKLVTIEDPSNLDTAIDRNYLRQKVLPLLGARWGGYRRTVARAGEHAAVGLAVINECLPLPKTVFSVLGDPGIEQRALNSVSVEAAMIILRRWLQSAGYSMPDQALLTEFMRQLREGAAASSPRLVCSNYGLQRYQNRVYLLPDFLNDEEQASRPESIKICPGEVHELTGVGTVGLVSGAVQGLSLDAHDTLELRWRSGGERCRPKGRPYNQRLKKLFQEFAVPPWWRERVPLLYLEDELLAVGGLWLCESSRLCAQEVPSEGLWQLAWQRKPCAFD